MASYTGSGNGGPSSSSSGYAPHAPSNLRQNYAHFGDHDQDPVGDFMRFLRRQAQSLHRFWNARGKRATLAFLLDVAHQLRRNLTFRRLSSFPHLMVMIWAVPSDATPHHLIFVADPQLIDPHSYPGRPWPISSLTVTVTDNYMRRSYRQLQEQLHPDTVFFLGDLFDGGREWRTFHGDSQDPSWNHRPKGEVGYAKKWKKKYGEDFWLKEYARFIGLFVNPWDLGGKEAGRGQRGRRLIASLPGNHDLGFGSEVKVPVRNRFEAYFGDVNRVDVIANHTFVSIDAVSLSARSSDDRNQGDLSSIYKPTEDFLNKAQLSKRKAVERELRRLRGEVGEVPQEHKIEDALSAEFNHIPTLNPGEGKAELPTILLSHVPLYRPPGTQCGPMREHWPPANPADPGARDDRNAISVSRGYQYQNVLNEGDSIDVVNKIGNIIHAFSGDDHDYCELRHADNQANVKEITVKSTSMAMGVPTPGFVMVSMYNPIDAEGKPLSGDQEHTLQTHLCLLPSQLSTYARYGGFAFVCAVALTIRAFLVPILNLQPFALDPSAPGSKSRSALPMFKAKLDDHDPEQAQSGYSGYRNGSSASSFNSAAPHRSATRDRSASFTPGVRANGLVAQARNASPKRTPGGGGNAKGLARHSSNREKNGGRWGGWGHGPKIEIDIGEDDEYYYDAGKSRWKATTATAPHSPILSSIGSAIPRATVANITLTCRPLQQRRYSSSKPSRDNDSGDLPVNQSVQPSTVSKTAGAKSSGDKRKRKAKESSEEQQLPRVPSTQSIPNESLALSSFFSLHRPISVTHSLPRIVTDDAFAAIFTQRARAAKPSEVMSTISRTVQGLEQPMASLSVESDANTPHETEAGIQKLDMMQGEGAEAAVSVQINSMSGNFLPFRPPPLPQPHSATSTTEAAAGKAGSDAALAAADADQQMQTRVYRAVFTIEESTDAHGDVKILAHSPELIEEPQQQQGSKAAPEPRTFLERMAQRQMRYEAISVKRQRKLKMKKKKYKKLQKRLRHEKRKHDR
ncbi:hypothetical protein INS49_002915 [Diaporthe citri]|uniref:uncharacterized protein n=1 Tax=Diaporthe citri TaxID=83186 RepID=UPI001C81CC2A|nr:uncharacterized protein INS49_002915 [Diaporthe citri]KAG6368702.1 hypothetical protein INS49_002915 [Diaporthe citri]